MSILPLLALHHVFDRFQQQVDAVLRPHETHVGDQQRLSEFIRGWECGATKSLEVRGVPHYENAVRILAAPLHRNLFERFVRGDAGSCCSERASLGPADQPVKQARTRSKFCFKEFGTQIVLVKNEPYTKWLQEECD